MSLTEQQVAVRMNFLPERFADRLADEDLRFSVSARNAGEEGASLESLIAALHRRRTTISTREARTIRELLATFRPALVCSDIGARDLELMTRWLDELTVVPSLGEPEMIDTFKALVARLADRLPPREIDRLTVCPDEEEPGVWFEVTYDLMRFLVRNRTPISGQERAELTQILDTQDLPRDKLRHLPTL